MQCEHEDGNLMGSCAICGDTTCGECFQSLFNAIICGNHTDLEDEGEWELVGFFMLQQSVDERRYYLTEQSLTSMSVETDEDVIELHVPAEDKAETYTLLAVPSEDIFNCDTCQVIYSVELESCPVCGTAPVAKEAAE